ncbi:MAG: ATPase [Actinobacteria bacterium]|nr:MAG: ATPase [Actinomycetota bacterium]
MTDFSADQDRVRTLIEAGDATLGIECGSTRIKAVLIDGDCEVLAVGGYAWENQLVDGRWSYALEDVHTGVRAAYSSLVDDVQARYGVTPTTYASMGISAMMHGYLAFDADGELLVPFRTWRNVSTGPAAEALTEVLDFNIPQRWSVAHVYQAILDREDHVPAVAKVNTLAGYVHELLTGRHVLGVGDASGMFPIDTNSGDYDEARVKKFNELVAARGVSWGLRDLFPAVLSAGDDAGTLTAEGAAFLDPTGALKPGVPLCPPEGDAGTGMVATHAVAPRTGNVSAGTSIFAMVVLETALTKCHLEIDPVTTPDGAQVAMVHSNNGASEIDAWVGMFVKFAELAGMDMSVGDVYETLYRHALEGAADGDGLMAYNFLSGEPVLGVDEGRPLFVHAPDAEVTLANALRVQLMSIFAALRVGMDILRDEEGVELDRLFAHGGIFKTPGVAQKVLADALRTSIAVGETAGEGGAWGIAVLARYLVDRGDGESLAQYLDTRVFAGADVSVIDADADDAAAFERFLARYREGLDIVRAAAETVH